MTDDRSIGWQLNGLVVVLLLVAKGGLRVSSLETVLRTTAIVARVGLIGAPPAQPDGIGTVVSGASRRVPGTSCLTTAVAAYALLTASGHDPELQIGVRRADDGLHAHAWVTANGQPVIGDDVTLSRYDRLGTGRPGR